MRLPSDSNSESSESDVEKSELFKLLRLAEEVRSRYDEAERRFSTTRVTLIGLTTVSLASLATFAQLALVNDWGIYATVLVLAAVAATLFTFIALIQNRARRSRTEKRVEGYALEELVSLLQQAEKSLIASSRMTTLERAEYRIRLARFRIPRDPVRPV